MSASQQHKQLIYAGKDLKSAAKAILMVHGRGATADDILSLAPHLPLHEFAIIAPQATNFSWYPNSFLAQPQLNEPWLSSAINLLSEASSVIEAAGISSEHTYFLGFSQGACLSLEYVTRNAKQYGGVIAFTGGLIGDQIYEERYTGDFHATPVFIGSSNPDPHVPVDRVKATTTLLRKMNANVTEKIYESMGHTVNEDEIGEAIKILQK